MILGIGLTVLASFNLKHFYANWGAIVSLINNTGNTLILLALISFFFLVSIHLCHIYIKLFTEAKYYTLPNILAVVKNGLRIILALVVFNVLLSAFEWNRQYFDMAHNVIDVIIISAIAWVVLQILGITENSLHRKYSSFPVSADARGAIALYTKFHIIKNISTVIIIVVAIAASLMVFDKVKNIGISLLASAGFLTAIVALAAQKTLGSFFVGLQLVLTHPLEIGDIVVVEGEFGSVEEINISYVIVKIWDSRRLVLPISYFIEKPLSKLV